MISIYLIKIINIMALIFVPLNLMYSPSDIGSNGLIFVWLCVSAFGTNALRRRKSKLFLIPAAGIFLSLLFAKVLDDYIYIGAFSIIAFYLGIWGMKSIDYDTEYEILRKGAVLCAGTFFISVIATKIGLFNRFSAQFIIIFLVSSVLLLRTLRNMQYSGDNSEARKINNRYSIVLIILSAIMSISYVREMVVKAIKYAYSLITEGFMWLFSWFFFGIAYVLGIVTNALKRLVEKMGKHLPKVLQNVNPPEGIKVPKVENIRKSLLEYELVNIAMKVIIIFMIIYIIVRILKYLAAKGKDEGQYIEEREFITNSALEGNNPLKKLLNFLKPKNKSEHIRLYYQKYMKMCMNNNVEIQKHDTTQDINIKAQGVFNRSLIDEIRNIYIKIRYGNKEATIEMVKKMGENYSRLKK